MRQISTRHALVALLVAPLALAAGCGDDDAASDTAGRTAGSPSTTSAAGSDDTGARWAELDVRYEHPDADIELEYTVRCAGEAGASTSGPTTGTTGADGTAAEVTGDAQRADVEAADACAALSDPAVVERLVAGERADQTCTQIYGGPDVAHIEGTIEGAAVDTTIDRADGCGIHDWDELLAPILPPAIGVLSPPTPSVPLPTASAP